MEPRDDFGDLCASPHGPEALGRTACAAALLLLWGMGQIVRGKDGHGSVDRRWETRPYEGVATAEAGAGVGAMVMLLRSIPRAELVASP